MKGRVWALVGVGLLACLLGLWRLEVESIWHDEAWSIRAIRSPFGTPDDNTPYLYYLIQHLFQRSGAGETPFALRYGSVLIHLLTVAFGLRIASRWYGLTAGITAGGLLAVSPLLWEYAQEIRAYVAVPLIALMLLAGAEAFLQRRRAVPVRLWAFILLTEIAGLYTHNLAVPIVVWLNLVIIWTLGWRWLFQSTDPLSPYPHQERKRSIFKAPPYVWGGVGTGWRQLTRHRLMGWLASQAMLLILYIPWLLTQAPSGTTLNTVPRLNAALAEKIWQGYFFPVPADDLPLSLQNLMILAAALLSFAVLIMLWQERSRRNEILLSQAVLLPLFSSLLIIRASIDFHPRYYVLGVPALLLLCAAALGHLPTFSRPGTAIVIMGVAGLISYRSLHLIADQPRYQHDNFQAIAEYYATLPADALILIPFGDEPALAMYFRDHLNIQAEMVLLPLHSSPAEAITLINAALPENLPAQVELLTWFQVPADERLMYPCLLASHSTGTGTYFETFGLASTGYQITAPIQMEPVAFEHQFSGALQLSDMQISQNQTGQVCLQSVWALHSPPPSATYSTAAQISNPFGWALAVQDSLITRDDQARLASWQVGDTGAAFALLELPPAIRPEQYGASLRLYTPDEMSGWDVLNAAGQSLGKDLKLALELQGNATPVAVAPALVRDNTLQPHLYSGQRLQVEVLSHGADVIRLIGEGWQVEQAIPVQPGLVWAELQVPLEASGEAELWVGDELTAIYPIQYMERLWTAPQVDIPIQAEFPGAGTLVGVNLSEQTISREQPLVVQLVWQASTTPAQDYVVFIQLLTPEGRLLGQVDALPLQGERPTSGWLAGEYLLDSHQLHRNELEYTGEAVLIVGLYEARTATRITLDDGSTYATVPVTIEVR